jgi:predicted peptidase
VPRDKKVHPRPDANPVHPRQPHGFLKHVHKGVAGVGKYEIFVPYSYRYKGTRKFPLILFLHGKGESGADGVRQTMVGLGPVVKRRVKTFPFLVVFPQAQFGHQNKDAWTAGTPDARRAMAILAEVQKHFRVAERHIYLTGLSMGGHGTWSLAAVHSHKWAAIVPIAAWDHRTDAARIKNIPCWCFQGAADPIVSVRNARQMIQALRAAGGHPKYTEYPGVGHDSWDRAYATPGLCQWMLQQRRP